MPDDPIVDAVRRIRDELAARFNYDVHAIFRDLRERESREGSRLVRQPLAEEPAPTGPPTGAKTPAGR